MKAYYALKAAGEDPAAEHMRVARDAVLAHGGAAKAMCSHGSCWPVRAGAVARDVPYVPVEIMLFPRWAPFHIDKISYWARTTWCR
jgi:squalene-hopene/tetraprenyl-beta-curcumene cyclase